MLIKHITTAALRPFRAVRRFVRHLQIAHDDVSARARMAVIAPAGRGRVISVRCELAGDWVIVRTLGHDMCTQEVFIHRATVGPLLQALVATIQEEAA